MARLSAEDHAARQALELGGAEAVPGRREVLHVRLEHRHGSFAGSAAIVRDGDDVTLGDWEPDPVGCSAHGRFVDLLPASAYGLVPVNVRGQA